MVLIITALAANMSTSTIWSLEVLSNFEKKPDSLLIVLQIEIVCKNKTKTGVNTILMDPVYR